MIYICMLITARVKTRQKCFSVKKGEIWQISVRSDAKENKANIEIIKELSKEYRNVRILSGLKSKEKRLDLGDRKP